MKKQDFPPLFTPGIHSLTLDEFELVTVTPFPNDAERHRLFFLFAEWLKKLQSSHVTARIWIDGSFVTAKNGPGDIDCIMWDPSFTVPETPELRLLVEPLLDRGLLKAQRGMHFFMESPPANTRLTRESTWRGLFGFQHDGKSPKGFVELKI